MSDSFYSASSSITAKILRQVQHACPNIARISLDIRRAWDDRSPRGSKPFHDVLDDPTFTFPLLKQILICDYYAENLSRYEAFLLRHPNIQDLRYDGSWSSYWLVNSKLFPELSRLDADPSPCASICSSKSRPIESLALRSEGYPDAFLCLQDVLPYIITTLRRLCIYNDTEYVGITLEDVLLLTSACPRLTQFECPLEFETASIKSSCTMMR